MYEEYKLEVLKDFTNKVKIRNKVFVELAYSKGEILSMRVMSNWTEKKIKEGYLKLIGRGV